MVAAESQRWPRGASRHTTTTPGATTSTWAAAPTTADERELTTGSVPAYAATTVTASDHAVAAGRSSRLRQPRQRPRRLRHALLFHHQDGARHELQTLMAPLAKQLAHSVQRGACSAARRRGVEPVDDGHLKVGDAATGSRVQGRPRPSTIGTTDTPEVQ